jgi:hypothetical protein
MAVVSRSEWRSLQGDSTCRDALLVNFSSAVFLFLLFVMDGFALPMGTKLGEVAFAIMDPQITAIVASAAIACLHVVWRSAGTDRYDVLVAPSLLAVAVHLAVAAVLYAVDQWPFVDSIMFLLAWEKERCDRRAC